MDASLQGLEYAGIILILAVYMSTLYWIDKGMSIRAKPLLVGFKGKVFPLEELLECSRKFLEKNRELVDPLTVESKCMNKDTGLGFTQRYTGITAIMLSIPVASYILWRTITPIIVSSIMLLVINIVLYVIYRSIRIESHIEAIGSEQYRVTITVSSQYPVKIVVVDNPPLGLVVGETIRRDTRSCTLSYQWIPVKPGVYSWKPSLILIEDPAGLLRIDFSSKASLKVAVDKTPVMGEHVGGYIGQSYNYPTIREPVVDKVREYSPGDSLRDLIPRSLLSPSGIAVKEYERLYEERFGGAISLVVLGPLSMLDREYLAKLLTYATVYSPTNKIGLLLGEENNLIIVNRGQATRILAEGANAIKDLLSRRIPLSTVKDNLAIVFLDPSSSTLVKHDRVLVVLPYDWRVGLLESYKTMWRKLVEKIVDELGGVLVVY